MAQKIVIKVFDEKLPFTQKNSFIQHCSRFPSLKLANKSTKAVEENKSLFVSFIERSYINDVIGTQRVNLR